MADMRKSTAIKNKRARPAAGGAVSTHKQTSLAVMILAKDEEKNIGRILDDIAAQTLCDRHDVAISIYVAANGCRDATAQVARRHAKSLKSLNVKTEVFDWSKSGKSRSWNRLIHDKLPMEVDYILAVDADIGFADLTVLALMLDCLRSNDQLAVVSGYPIKETARKAHPNLIDRFSMSVSRHTRHSGVINGSLYLARASFLQEIWLPDETPGEDGFLNAMVMTRGFSRSERPEIVAQLASPTHYFESHTTVSYFAHEKRMLVGTMINRWIFEYLQSLQLSEPAGPMIEMLNRNQPEWVDRLVEKETTKRWLIPNELLLRRLRPKNGINLAYLLRLPILCLATLLTLPPAFTANRALKRRGAASTW